MIEKAPARGQHAEVDRKEKSEAIKLGKIALELAARAIAPPANPIQIIEFVENLGVK